MCIFAIYCSFLEGEYGRDPKIVLRNEWTSPNYAFYKKGNYFFAFILFRVKVHLNFCNFEGNMLTLKSSPSPRHIWRKMKIDCENFNISIILHGSTSLRFGSKIGRNQLCEYLQKLRAIAHVFFSTGSELKLYGGLPLVSLR